MNKKNNFGQICFGRRETSIRLALCCAVVAACLTMSSQVNAQSEFGFQYDSPTTASPAFPSHPTFDPNVQPADLLQRGQANDSVQPATHVESPDALVGSANSMVSSMTSTLQSQWENGNWKNKFGSFFQNMDIGRMLGSLAIVLGGYFGLVWFSRQMGGGSGKVPNEVLEVLGQIPFGPKKQLQIVRLGSKLLLLINGPEGTHPIGEITDPDEVEYLASLCPGRKTANGAHALRIAKAAASRSTAAAPTTVVTNVPAQAAPASTAGVQMAANPNHLAAILQTLNGQSGTAAVFEA